mgnify:CR=1 FL=1
MEIFFRHKKNYKDIEYCLYMGRRQFKSFIKIRERRHDIKEHTNNKVIIISPITYYLFYMRSFDRMASLYPT